MKTRLVNATTYLVIFGIVLLAGGCGSSQTDLSKSGQVLAKVGDKEITTSYFDRQIANLPNQQNSLLRRGRARRPCLRAWSIVKSSLMKRSRRSSTRMPNCNAR